MTSTSEEPTEPYQPADRQLHPAIGPNLGTEDLDVELLSSVLERIDRLDRAEWPDEPGAVPAGANGERLSLPPLDLPGFGDQGEPDCGDPIPHFCEGCGSTTTVGRTCTESTCPRCAAAWCRDRTVNVCSRLAAARASLDAVEDDHIRYHHLAINLPDEWAVASDQPLRDTFRMLYDVLDEMGLQGYVFYHPYRGDPDQEEDDRGKWKDRLFEGREWSDVLQELSFRPHFHAIVVGHEVPGGQFTKELYDETEIVLKRITRNEESKVSIYNEHALARAVSYCISHTGIRKIGENHQVQYNPFGEAVHPSDGVTVYESRREEMDKIVRSVVPTTLGLQLSSGLCSREVLGGGETHDSARASLIAQHAPGDSSTEPIQEEWEPAGSSNLTHGEEDVDDDELELEPCEERLLHIKKAPDYLDDPDWRAEAPSVDERQTTWDEWADRLDELPGG